MNRRALKIKMQASKLDLTANYNVLLFLLCQRFNLVNIRRNTHSSINIEFFVTNNNVLSWRRVALCLQ